MNICGVQIMEMDEYGKKESSISGAAKLLVEPALQTDIAIMYI